MHTTGLAREPIGRLYERERLALALRDARARSLAIYAHLDLGALEVPQISIVNLPLWELAHLAWFQEYWCLRRLKSEAPTRDSILPGADAMFDSGAVPHATRWMLPYPPQERLFRYMEETLEATIAACDRVAEDELYYFALSVLHEDMHGEALLMTLQTLGLPAPAIAVAPAASAAVATRDIPFEGGAFAMGSELPSPHFVFDNEKHAHPVAVAPFAMATRPTTQGEFAAFVEDDGYSRSELWTEAGWAWREAAGREAPLHWRRNGSAWQRCTHGRWAALDANAPMIHLTLHEALAWCRWAGRRLPTEAEWEFAARNAGGDDRYPWGDAPLETLALDYRRSGARTVSDPATASRAGMEMLIGGVWEWTSSPFLPYPGFAPGPYRDYSQPWFGDHFVLRGGSFATRGRLVHSRFRNFYRPERADIFAGMRTCAGESG